MLLETRFIYLFLCYSQSQITTLSVMTNVFEGILFQLNNLYKHTRPTRYLHTEGSANPEFLRNRWIRLI